MKLYVISLQDAHDRRQQVNRNMAEIGVAFEFFDAVNGYKGLPDSLVDKPDDAYRVKFRGRPLTPGEKGCYASHYLVWKKCVDLNEPIAVFEDDFTPTLFFKQVIMKLPELHKKYDYLRLEPQDSNFKCQFIENTPDGFQILMWMDNAGGARGYSITPKAAKSFIKHSTSWLCAVDNFIGEPYKHKIPSMGLLPYAVFDSNNMESQIQNKTVLLKVKIGYKFLREISRIVRQIKLIYWNITYKVKL